VSKRCVSFYGCRQFFIKFVANNLVKCSELCVCVLPPVVINALASTAKMDSNTHSSDLNVWTFINVSICVCDVSQCISVRVCVCMFVACVYTHIQVFRRV
jgi:hypothetical protein